MKKLWNFILKPPTWFIAISVVCCVALVAISLVTVIMGIDQVWVYAVYGLTACFFAHVVYLIVKITPKAIAKTKEVLRKNALTCRIMDSYGFRTMFFAGVSLVISIAYGAYLAVSAVLNRSIWQGCLASYYIILVLIRAGVLLFGRSKESKSEGAYLYCGIMLTLLNVAMTVAVLRTFFEGERFTYGGLMIYVAATYAFYKISHSIYNIFKAKKQDDYAVKGLRTLSLSDAIMSIYALQTALIAEFSTGADGMEIMNYFTGGIVCLLTLFIGIYTTCIALKRKKEEKSENKINEQR